MAHHLSSCVKFSSFQVTVVILGFIHISIVEAAEISSAIKPAALFVFGDSYADTGNHNASDPTLNTSWKAPYGYTWPRHPSGRYSDGRVFTDFYASFLGMRQPWPYRRVIENAARKQVHAHLKHQKHTRGINFAFGGSGVFPTFGSQYPNVSVQMGQLHDLLVRGLVPFELIRASTALLVVSGNDYIEYEDVHGGYEGISEFIPHVVKQIVSSLETLHKMGFKSITVTNLTPLGCLPTVTVLNNYTSCDLTINELSSLHNSILSSNVSSLQAKLPNAQFLLFDLYAAFEAVIAGGDFPLEPCCEGIGKGSCGDLDGNGKLLYSLCSLPNDRIFWDAFHPSNEEWHAISKALFFSLEGNNAFAVY